MCVARTGSYFEFRAKNRKEEESLWLVSLRGLLRTTLLLMQNNLKGLEKQQLGGSKEGEKE